MGTSEPLSRPETIARLRALAANEIGTTATSLRSHDPSLLKAARLHFHNLAAARQAARVAQPRRSRKPSLMKAARTWSAQRIIDELRAVEARGDKAVDRFLKEACRRYYGSVDAARRAAGIERAPKWTPERVIEDLRTMVSNGQISIKSSLSTSFSANAARVFGNLETAYRSAGIDEIVMGWPKSKLLRVLREQRPLPDEKGYVHRLVREACVRTFGSVSAAFEAAGLPSRARSPKK